MTARKRKPARRSPKAVPCNVQITRGGVCVQVEGVALSQVGEVACYILSTLQQYQRQHPELSQPQEVVQIGGYTPVEVVDDDTWARKVGF